MLLSSKLSCKAFCNKKNPTIAGITNQASSPSGYPLPSLEETAAYIKAYKHLPEIPSATKMEKEGINLKEMNLLLLKKWKK
ncbi:hypothetical protein DN752_21405 [Echinicola strongylocentroti]|uniref:Uncharacterized protein n=1 Tax=Echinicola strongylocentroti TaxID=1795355 RepID=A0A2Z4IP18_9BACT|nr:hypothetical protein [Echinicola strongylocentroti]AWW32499.1 hypothetical protein DN752_21405 [Echinicola strongylocentroti]